MRLRSPLSLLALATALGASACQDYPFEKRYTRRQDVRKISEAVLTVRPTDILFVVDNSGTMEEERAAIRNNLVAFLDRLIDSATDFQIGLVTTDVECNVPGTRVCGPGGASVACCNLRGTTTCTDDLDTGYTDCDAGRLRSATGLNRIFQRPQAAEREAWIGSFSDTIAALDCDAVSAPTKPQGSAYEAGLEAALRAVACSVGQDCPDPAVAQLNAGFVRPDADLVIVFITDEDDCSFRDASAYQRVADASDPNEQAAHLCEPDECYAHYGAQMDTDGDSIADWADPSAGGYFTCSTAATGGVARVVDPPVPDSPSTYLDALVALKGGDVKRIRAAGILSGVVETDGSFRDSGCFAAATGPSADCRCLSTTPETSGPFCELTDLLGQHFSDGHFPAGGDDVSFCKQTMTSLGGCTSMPGSRYSAFLRELGDRRAQAGTQRDVLVDSICQWGYDDTLFRIVNNVIIRNCFELGTVPGAASDITVKLNGVTLANVEPGSLLQGWSWRAGGAEICLEGGLHKNIDDRFEIFVLSSDP